MQIATLSRSTTTRCSLGSAEDTTGCNLLLVGLGPHARRTYVPHLLKHATRFGACLAAVVELEATRPTVEAVCASHGISPEQVYVSPFQTSEMPIAVRERLDALVVRQNINGIIISTEPLAHKAYLSYALQRGLNILVDKPITTRTKVAHDPEQARGISADYREILRLYRELQVRQTTCLLVNSHRRYHPGFRAAFEMIAEIRERFGCPVSGIASEHCDGQWRLPAEIERQTYHPYNQGYGKVSHSGYHLLDMINCFMEAGTIPEKGPDTLALTSSFVLPGGFLHQLQRDDYLRCFGPEYEEVCPHSDDTLRQKTSEFGEIDASALLEFWRHGDVVAQVTMRMQHNGFGRRTWVRPGKDLYKGNGRVRHERHRVDSGPFQTLYIESYQAKDKHDRSDKADFDLGGNNHFDLLVFRNCGLTGDKKPLQVYRLCDLPGTTGLDTTLLYNEQVKEAVLLEFLQFLRGEKEPNQLCSTIETHELTVRLMSGIYEAHALRRQGAQGWVKIPL